MNSHTWLSAVPPTISAGPRLRAGFTEVPVIGMPMRCTTVSDSPMTIPAVAVLPSLPVTPRTTNTNSAVSTTSARNAPPAPMWMSDAAPQPFVPSPVADRLYGGDVENIPHSSRAPRMPPMNCAIQ